MKLKSARFAVLSALLITCMTRCSGSSITEPGIVSVTLTPPSATVRVGATVQLNASTGGGSPTEAITYVSDNPAVVSVTATGLARALALGTATIKGSTASGISGSAVVTVIAGPPASIAKTAGDNQTTVAGSAVAIAPTVVVRDSAGNVLLGVPVTFAVASGGGTITGGAATTNGAGSASVGSYVAGSVGANTLSATVAGLPAVTFTLTGTPATPGQIAINAGNGQTGVAGGLLPIAPSVIVTAIGGQPAVGVPVTFTVSSGGGSIASTTAVTNASGIATAGSWTLGVVPGANLVTAVAGSLPAVTFTATGTGPLLVLSANTVSISSMVGGAVPNPVVVQITNGSSGTLGGLQVGSIVYGAGASGWLAASLAGSTGPTTLTLTANPAGLVPGTYTATVPVSAGGASASPQSVTVTLTVNPGTPRLIVASQPNTATSGALLSPQVAVQLTNALGGVIVGGSANITVNIISGQATLSGATTVAVVNGIATFADLRITGSGSVVLGFTTTGVLPVTSFPIVLGTTAVAPATQLAFGTQPGGAVSGAPFTTQPVVQVRDAAGNIVAGATDPVSVTVNGAGAVISGTTTVNAVNGVATFNDLRITGAGSYTLTFSSGSLTPVTSSAFTVTSAGPAPATNLFILTQPGGAITGNNLDPQPVLQIKDAQGNVVTTGSFVVTATWTDLGFAVPSGSTTATSVNGVVTFTDLRITGPATYTITFTSPGLTPVSSVRVVIAPTSAPTSLAITTQPSGATSGVSFTAQPVIAIRDGNGGTVNGANNPVTVSIASGTGTLAGTLTPNTINGVATFSALRIVGSGPHTLLFTSPGLASATSASFMVTALPATRLAMNQQPGGALSGEVLAPQPIIQLRDVNGNAVPGVTNTVVATLNGTGGTLSGTTSVAAVDGQAYFNDLKVTGAGTYTLTFSSGSLTPVTSSSFTITAPVTVVGVSLGIETQPGGATSGAAFVIQPAIEIRSASNARVTTATNVVRVAIASGNGVLSGNTQVNAVNGVATFTDLRITGTGAHTLVFTSTGLTSVTSASFTVAPPASTRLTFSIQAGASAVSGALLSPAVAVAVVDANNFPVSSPSTTISVSLNGTGGTLSGTTTRPAPNGSVQFTDLRITGPGIYTLTFTSGSNAPLTSGNIIISAPGTESAVAPAIASIAMGNSHACGIAISGAAYCWGNNDDGQLGTGNMNSSSVPVAVTGGLQFSAIAAGSGNTCGLTTTGAAYCWGSPSTTGAGMNTVLRRTLPTVVAGGHTYRSIAMGPVHVCAITANGDLYCWGGNSNLQLGIASLDQNSQVDTPTRSQPGFTWKQVTIYSNSTTCGLTTGGDVYCWGGDSYLYGDPSRGNPSTTTRPASAVATKVPTSQTFTTFGSRNNQIGCGINAANEMHCWGLLPPRTSGEDQAYRVAERWPDNRLYARTVGECSSALADGQVYCVRRAVTSSTFGLGAGTNLYAVPQVMAGGLNFALFDMVGTTSSSTAFCGVTTAGAGYCTGSNENGKLGNGTTSSVNVPTLISGGLTFKTP